MDSKHVTESTSGQEDIQRLGGKKRLYIKSIPVAFKTAMATESVT